MVDQASIDQQIATIRQHFNEWRSKHLDAVFKTFSPDGETRKSGIAEANQAFQAGGKAYIENALSRIATLHQTSAQNRGMTAVDAMYANYQLDKASMAKGLDTLKSQGKDAAVRYLQFKAHSMHKETLHPADLMATVGSWKDESFSDAEAKEIALASLKPLGLNQLAADVFTGKTNGAGQAFWQKWEKTYRPSGGLMDIRLATKEGAHAAYCDLAGTENVNLAVDEVATMFSEALFKREMLRRATSPKQKIAMLANQLDSDVEIINQAGKFGFEQDLYKHVDEHPGKPLPVTALWRKNMEHALGDQINWSSNSETVNQELLDSRLMLWNHYMMTDPGYSSNFMIGAAATPHLLQKFDEDPEGFAKKFQDLLRQGNNVTTDEFLKAFDIDMKAPNFWEANIQRMNADIDSLQGLQREQLVEEFTHRPSAPIIPAPAGSITGLGSARR